MATTIVTWQSHAFAELQGDAGHLHSLGGFKPASQLFRLARSVLHCHGAVLTSAVPAETAAGYGMRGELEAAEKSVVVGHLHGLSKHLDIQQLFIVAKEFGIHTVDHCRYNLIGERETNFSVAEDGRRDKTRRRPMIPRQPAC